MSNRTDTQPAPVAPARVPERVAPARACANIRCTHRACEIARDDARHACQYCDKPIGFVRPFKRMGGDRLTHYTACPERTDVWEYLNAR